MGMPVDSDTVQAGLPAEDDDAPIVGREDGVWFRADATRRALHAAAGDVFLSGRCFAGLDYDMFQRMLYFAQPRTAPVAPHGRPLVRVADAIVPFPPGRRGLYKSVKIVAGAADYFFEPVFLDTGDGEPQPATLAFDEFVADMWVKGVRFGIDPGAVRAGMAATRPGRRVVARSLDPVPGRDAAIVEVSEHLHRSNAPRDLGNGRFDLHTFQNRFPQVKAHVRLLRKEARTDGTRGFRLCGTPIEAAAGKDVSLAGMAGAGTAIEHRDGHDYLVSTAEGFINVDRKSGSLSIGQKIIGRDGVSVRTTGNLQLSGEYEEFGDVQENRVVEGGSITIHGNVFGRIASRGGTVQLKRNLMGGTIVNAAGAIRVGGVASNAVLQAKGGEIMVRQAQNCVITAARVTIGEASNCEILADEVAIGTASGCAIAGRDITLTGAGPRKGTEMLLFALVPDTRRYDDAIADLTARIDSLDAEAGAHRRASDEIANRQEVRSYLALSAHVRAKQVTLAAAQQALYRKMAERVEPVLTELARLLRASNAARTESDSLREQVETARRRRGEIAIAASCRVKKLDGDTVLRTMVYHPDTGPPYGLAPKHIKERLRAASWSHAPVLRAAEGALDWSST
jgi:hypothetical protein